ncbi:MAG: GNAT family N-acetyltransferase [Ignavibacteriae bacterium]|nr:GNAT family N-acetyltransferase [Ignavibacteriota bacterium]
MKIDSDLKIRNANLTDTDSIVSLTIELGYSPTHEEIKSKIKKISKIDEQAVFVAEYENVIGWIHITLVEPLESLPFVEIKGIVVNLNFRGKGIGTKLIEEAEKWASSKGLNRIRVRTNIKRAETIDYYKKIGFSLKKTQEVFEKMID